MTSERPHSDGALPFWLVDRCELVARALAVPLVLVVVTTAPFPVLIGVLVALAVGFRLLRRNGAACPRCGMRGAVEPSGRYRLVLACDQCGGFERVGFWKAEFRRDLELHAPVLSDLSDAMPQFGENLGMGGCELGDGYTGLRPPDVSRDGDFSACDQAREVEVKVEHGRLASVRFELETDERRRRFGADWVTSEQDFVEAHGKPYWRDEDDEEVLLFYEFDRGEMQIEFDGKGPITNAVLVAQPLMARAKQRQAYGVDAPWPPPGVSPPSAGVAHDVDAPAKPELASRAPGALGGLLVMALGFACIVGPISMLWWDRDDFQINSVMGIASIAHDIGFAGFFVAFGCIAFLGGALIFRGAVWHQDEEEEVEQAERRWSIEREGQRSVVTVSGNGHPLAGMLFGSWALAWSAMPVALAVSVLTEPMSIGLRLGLGAVALVLGSIGWLIFIEAFWHFRGKERVELSPDGLTILTDMTVYRPRARYPGVTAKNLRVSPGETNRVDPIRTAALAFNHEGETYRFGGGLSNAEAQALRTELLRLSE